MYRITFLFCILIIGLQSRFLRFYSGKHSFTMHIHMYSSMYSSIPNRGPSTSLSENCLHRTITLCYDLYIPPSKYTLLHALTQTVKRSGVTMPPYHQGAVCIMYTRLRFKLVPTSSPPPAPATILAPTSFLQQSQTHLNHLLDFFSQALNFRLTK